MYSYEIKKIALIMNTWSSNHEINFNMLGRFNIFLVQWDWWSPVNEYIDEIEGTWSQLSFVTSEMNFQYKLKEGGKKEAFKATV